MLRTKQFDGFYSNNSHRLYEGVDVQINRFLDENPKVELVDVKILPSVMGYGTEFHSETIALIVYKVNDNG